MDMVKIDIIIKLLSFWLIIVFCCYMWSLIFSMVCICEVYIFIDML